MESTECKAVEDVDLRNSRGMTPLMGACWVHEVEKVRELLSKGADPNKKCDKTLFTPMHFTCDLSGFDLSDVNGDETNYRQEDEKITILKLLLENGAVCTKDRDGLTPLCLAAVTGCKSVVEFFESVQRVDRTKHDLDFVKAYELLGVTTTICHETDWNPSRKSGRFPSADKYFKKAKSLQHSRKDLNREELDTSTYLTKPEKLFTREVGQKAPGKDAELYAKGLITAFNFLPLTMIDTVLLENFVKFAFASFAFDAFYGVKNGAKMLEFLIDLELKGHLRIGTVLERVSSALAQFHLLRGPSTSVIESISRMLKMYGENLDESKYDTDDSYEYLREEAMEQVGRFGRILVLLTFYQERAALDLVSLVRAAIQFTQKTSKAFEKLASNKSSGVSIIRYMLVTICFELKEFTKDSDFARSLQHQLFSAICLILPHDPDIQCRPSMMVRLPSIIHGTSLQLLMWFTSVVAHAHGARLFTWVARLLVRYGCTYTNAKSSKEIFISSCQRHNIDPTSPHLAELVKILSPGVVSLEELAVRVVLQRKIPYKDRLPKILCDFIDGGFTEKDLIMNRPVGAKAEQE